MEDDIYPVNEEVENNNMQNNQEEIEKILNNY